MKVISRIQRLRLERLGDRRCLSAIALVSHDVVMTDAQDPKSIFAADLDGDGDVDLLFGSDGLVAWQENVDGRGDLSRRHVISDHADSTTSVIAADLDGDDDPDVIVGSRTQQLSWFENLDGKGQFGAPSLIDGHASLLVAGDLDGDGDVDVAGASSQRPFEIYENSDGRGTFLKDRPFETARSTSLALSDLDDDGDLDLVTGSPTWYENQSTDTQIAWLERPVATESQLTDVANMDGDGDLDLVAWSIYGFFQSDIQGELTWIENLDGAGNFGTHHDFFEGTVRIGPLDVTDIDGDGDADVVATFSSGSHEDVAFYEMEHTLRWFENRDGRGTMIAGQTLSEDPPIVSSLTTADLNGDGTPDPILASVRDDSISWFPNQGSDFGIRQAVVEGGFGSQEIEVWDIDGDRDEDLVTGVSWFENLGRGEFDATPHRTPGWARGRPFDLDGDGDLDRLRHRHFYLDGGGPYVELLWYENLDGGLTFGSGVRIDRIDGFDFDPPLVMDFDADGDSDIVWKGREGVKWYENLTELGTFAQGILFEPSPRGISQQVLAGDLDQDGDLDLLFLTDGAFWRENAAGIWQPPREIVRDVDRGPSDHLALGDLDRDSDLDLLVGSYSGITWIQNEGSGNFGEPRKIETLPADVVLPADVDGDGDLDIVHHALNQSGLSTIAWHENLDGQGNFGRRVIANTSATSIAVADFDGDGDLDIATQSSWTDQGSYYENTDGTNFATRRILRDRDHEIRLAVGDIDGDGDTDLATVAHGNDYSFAVRWYQDRKIGDSNNDGRFDSADLVAVFQAGKYDDGIANDASFDEGDWNGDGDFDSSDLVLAFQTNLYESAAQADIAAAVEAHFAPVQRRPRGFAP